MVMAFNIAFILMGFSLSNISSDAFVNFNNYYTQAMAHNVSASAANIASSGFYQAVVTGGTYTPPVGDVSFQGGTFQITRYDYPDSVICLATSSSYGTMFTTNALGFPVQVPGVARDTLILSPVAFCLYAVYTDREHSAAQSSTNDYDHIFWTSSDTVWGPFHSQQGLDSYGHPVFMGPFSSNGATHYYNNTLTGNQPVFNGTVTLGKDVRLPSDLSSVSTGASSGGKLFNNPSDNVYLWFHPNGQVSTRIGTSGSWTTYSSVSALTPNGVIAVNNNDLHIKGVVNGQVTLAAMGTGGRVYLDSSIVLKTSPLSTSPVSTDYLGICAQNDIIIPNNTNNNHGINIQASLLSVAGGLKADGNADASIASNGSSINILGGIQQGVRGIVGHVSGGVVVQGYKKNYRYDTRFLDPANHPPYYPPTKTFKVLSWYEE
jgi:hypothetical protein